ncbi:heterokaryon incompatibility, partial [Cercophora newfieldiana]
KYEALSYTWGSPVHKCPITINNRPCLIWGNLYTALLALRYEDKPRHLWIDAICINQDDIAEKNLHIPQMHLVYQRAASVTVWLGPPFEDSDVAFS